MKVRPVCIFLVALFLVLMSSSLWAQAPNNPVGLWRFTAYDDTTPALNQLNSQNICFLANNTWFGTQFAGWAGNWFQKGNNAAGNGDRVRLVGNFGNGNGNDSAELDFINLDLITGKWNEFMDLAANGTGFTIYLNVEAEFLGPFCPIIAAPVSPAISLETQRLKTPFEK